MGEIKICLELLGAAGVHPASHSESMVRRYGQCIGSVCYKWGSCAGSAEVRANGSGAKEEEVSEVPKKAKGKKYTDKGKKPGKLQKPSKRKAGKKPKK